ncbi:MAG: endonuclease III [Candidatus Bipolaricaulota bacterium]
MDAHAVLVEVHRRLTGLYGEPPQKRQEPLDLLVRTILSQNTSDRNRDRAYASLRSRWASWEEVLEAPVEELADAIKGAGLHHQRAKRIQEVLGRIQARQGRLELGFLRRMPPAEAESWLLSLPGVGKKTAYIILLMGFGIPRFPVDTHVGRVTTRLGVVRRGVEPHKALAPVIPAGRETALHLNMIRLGREVCVAGRPRCADCPLPELCAYIMHKADPKLRAALREGKTPPVLVRRAGEVVTSKPDRPGLLALLSDPAVSSAEAASSAAVKEVP